MVVIALFVTMLFAVKTAKADTGGYDVISVGDVATVRINAGINPAYLNAVFGTSFKEATGVNFLSPDGYEKMMALNPESMTPACRHPGDGAEFTKKPNATVDEKLAVWISCKKENMELWYKPNTIVKIPVKSTVVIAESFSATLARHKALDACEDVACVASNTKSEKLKAALTGLPTAAPAPVAPATPSPVPSNDSEALSIANAKIKDLESKLAQAPVVQPAPVAPSSASDSKKTWLVERVIDAFWFVTLLVCFRAFLKERRRTAELFVLSVFCVFAVHTMFMFTQLMLQASKTSAWPTHFFWLGVILIGCVLGYFFFVKPKIDQINEQSRKIKEIEESLKQAEADYVEAARKQREAEAAKAQVEATLKNAQVSLNQFVSTDQAKQRMITDLQRQNVDLETRLAQQTANVSEVQRQAAAYSAHAETKSLECQQLAQQVATLNSQLSAQTRDLLHAADMKIQLQEHQVMRSRLAKVNETLDSMLKEYQKINCDLQACKHKKPMYEQMLQAFFEEPMQSLRVHESVDRNEREIATLNESFERLSVHMHPAMKERDEILRQLTGSADLGTLLFLETGHLHDEAEEAAVIAREERAKAGKMVEEVSATKAAFTAQVQEFEGMVQVHRELEESLVVRERELNEERRVFEENRRAENESLANRKAALNHLLDDACELLCNERGMSVESILKMDGASGLLSEAARRTRAAEARAAELTSSLDALAANVAMLTTRIDEVTAEKDFAVNDANGLREDARKIAESYDAEIAGLKAREAELEKSIASLSAEVETYTAIAERRNADANPSSEDLERKFDRTGSWGVARANGSAAPHGPVTQPMGIAAALQAKAEEVAAEKEASALRTLGQDEEEDPLLEVAGELIGSSATYPQTLKGTPAMMKAALRSTKPPVIDGMGTIDQPTNGGPRRSSTLDGIQPPTEEFLAPRFVELTKVLGQISGHLDTTSTKPILDRPTCDALLNFLRRPCELSRDLIESSPQALKILETDPNKQDMQIQVLVQGMTIAKLGESTKRLGIVFPRKTLMPPSSPPSSLRS